MKKIILLTLVMSASFVAPAAIAAPESNGDYFVEAKGGSVSIWESGTSTSSREILGGYRWDTGSFGKLGFELGYLHFGEIDSDTPSIGFAEFGATINQAHLINAGLDLNYTLPGQQLYFEPRIGLMRLSYSGVQRDISPDQFFTSTYYNETRTGHYVGIGMGVWFTPNFAASINFFDNYSAEILGRGQTINVASLGLQFQF